MIVWMKHIAQEYNATALPYSPRGVEAWSPLTALPVQCRQVYETQVPPTCPAKSRTRHMEPERRSTTIRSPARNARCPEPGDGGVVILPHPDLCPARVHHLNSLTPSLRNRKPARAAGLQ